MSFSRTWLSVAEFEHGRERAIRRIREVVDAIRERIAATRTGDVRVVPRVVRVRPQVTADDAEANGVEVERQPRRPALRQAPVDREFAEAHERAALHEVIVRIEVVVERAVVRRRLLAGRVRTGGGRGLPVSSAGGCWFGALIE